MISKAGACQRLSFIKPFFQTEFLGIGYEGHVNKTLSRSDMTEENMFVLICCA